MTDRDKDGGYVKEREGCVERERARNRGGVKTYGTVTQPSYDCIHVSFLSIWITVI